MADPGSAAACRRLGEMCLHFSGCASTGASTPEAPGSGVNEAATAQWAGGCVRVTRALIDFRLGGALDPLLEDGTALRADPREEDLLRQGSDRQRDFKRTYCGLYIYVLTCVHIPHTSIQSVQNC